MDIEKKIQNSFENAPKNPKNQHSRIRVWCFVACFARFMCSITLKLLPFATESLWCYKNGSNYLQSICDQQVRRYLT